jgi:hypothetical protein
MRCRFKSSIAFGRESKIIDVYSVDNYPYWQESELYSNNGKVVVLN